MLAKNVCAHNVPILFIPSQTTPPPKKQGGGFWNASGVFRTPLALYQNWPGIRVFFKIILKQE